jgi:crotonobetainyl-CoA:carnitine CoA-transferase CaiB-like acyl-CoA transferase
VHVSVLPFGAAGPKADWKAADINLQHASGEANLLPNGLSVELFPERPPVKIYGHFAEMQGGIAAALGALSALWARPQVGGQYVDYREPGCCAWRWAPLPSSGSATDRSSTARRARSAMAAYCRARTAMLNC